MKTKLCCLVGLAIGILNSISEAQPQNDAAKRLVGIWRLISFTQRLADGTTRDSSLSVGYIIYTDTDHMCAVLMDPNRPKWQLSSPYANTTNASEALSAVRGSDAYCSRVEVHAEEGFVLHHVDDAVRPNLVGITRKRWFTFQGPNRVVLRIDPAELTAPVVESVLTWERVVK